MTNNVTNIIEGFILSANKYSEKDAIVELYTKDGIINFKASGGFNITSKNHQACLISNFVQVDLSKRGENYFLAGIKTITDNTNLYSDMKKSLAIQVLIEASKSILQNGDIPPYEYFKNSILAIKNDFDIFTVIFINLCQLAKASGVGLNYSSCVNCDAKKNLVAFDFQEGGFICKNCASELMISHNDITYIKVIRYGFLVKPDQIERVSLPQMETKKAISDILTYFNDVLGVNIKSYKYLIS